MNTTADLRKRNMLEILKVTHNNPMISIPDIAKKLHLTSVTVSTLIYKLIERNLVIEQGEADSTGGRKALVYKFNQNSKNIIGINIQIGMVFIDLFDMSGLRVHKGARIKVEKGQSAEQTIFLMIKEIKNIMQLNDKTAKKILAVGITLPGLVDSKKGVVRKIANLEKWKSIPLKECFEDELKIPVYIESDRNSHLAYLKWSDIVAENGNVSYIFIGEGIGGSVMINGIIYHGDHGLAGEVGHTIMEIDGAPCNCGNRGCFEVLASNSAIIKYYAEELVKADKDASNVYAIIGDRSQENEYILEMAKRSMEGDKQADLAFCKASKYIRVGLSNMINTYDSSLLIIECKWMREARKYFNEIVSRVFEINEMVTRNDIKIILNPIEDILRVSTCMVVIDKLLENLDDNLFSNFLKEEKKLKGLNPDVPRNRRKVTIARGSL